MGPVPGAVHAIETEFSRSVRIGVPRPHPSNELVQLGPNAPDIVNGGGDPVPIVVLSGDVVVHPAPFDEPRFEHEDTESLFKRQIFEQPGSPAVPFMEVVSALAHGYDPLVANYRGNEFEIVIVFVMPWNG